MLTGDVLPSGHDEHHDWSTPAMLDIGRSSVPTADFRVGTLESLPVDDQSVDPIVSSLAVCHAERLEPVFDEFFRVLKSGGTLVLSDPHPTSKLLGGQAFYFHGDTLEFVRNQGRPISEYFNAAASAGLRVDQLIEVPIPSAAIESHPAYPAFPDVMRTGLTGLPFLFALVATKPDL